MIADNRRFPVRALFTLTVPLVLSAASLLLAQAPTGPEPPSQQERGAGGGRQGRGGFNQDNSAADFSQKAPIQA